MKITRDVIYDLLPAYFAGEVSADTRAIIDEFLATDAEFARMTARFQRLFKERGAADGGGIVAAERGRLEHARSRAERRQVSAGLAVGYTLAAMLPLAIDLLRGQGLQGKSLIISTVFAAVALVSATIWLVVRRPANAEVLGPSA